MLIDEGDAEAGVADQAEVGAPGDGLIVFALATLASGVVFAVLMPNRSNRDQPRETLSAKVLLNSFSFPRRGARDFYFAEGYHQQYLYKNPGGYCPLHATGVTCDPRG